MSTKSKERPPKPEPPTVDFETIPNLLVHRDRWIAWKYEWKPGKDKWDKVPLNPQRGHPDDATDPDVWVSFEEIKTTYHADHIDCDGIGFAFAEDDMIVGIDLDDCRDHLTGETETWAAEILHEVDSWTEISPSGTGFHIFAVGSIPDGGSRTGDVEMYDSGRYFTVTGNHLEDTPNELKERNDAIKTIHSEYIADDGDEDNTTSVDTGTSQNTSDVDLTDEQLIKKAKNAENSNNFKQLWNGNTGGYPSHSEADEALCFHLAFWTGKDKQRIDKLFRKSNLMRDKWDEDRGSQTYGELTIQKAVNKVSKSYDPSAGVKSPPEPKGLTDEDGNEVENDTESRLTPVKFQEVAGMIPEDGDAISDLNDKQKAANVWRLIKQSDEYHIRCDDENETIWGYDCGIWKPNGETQLAFACRKALGPEHFGNNVLRELKTQVRSDPYVRIDRTRFGVESGKVAVANGLLDLQKAADGDADALRDLHPSDYALSQLPVRYDADASTEACKDFVSDVVESGKIDAVQEYVGYCLHRGDMPFNRALLCVGSGANGKSTFLNMVRELLGPEHTESKPIHRFGERFATADLEGSIANIDADLSEGSLSRKGIAEFKRLVGGDMITAERKRKNPFQFKPSAKHLYACNKVPDVSGLVADTDEAFWRRWIIVEFPKYFPPQERDPKLEDCLTSEDNLPGVLLWAIEGWDRLMRQEHFTNIETTANDVRRLWQSWGESVDKFIVDCLERDEDADNISTNGLYQVYSKWCDAEGTHKMKQRALTTAVKNDGTDFGYKTSTRPIDLDYPDNGYTAVGFTDEAPDLQEALEDDEDDTDGTDNEETTRNANMEAYQ